MKCEVVVWNFHRSFSCKCLVVVWSKCQRGFSSALAACLLALVISEIAENIVPLVGLTNYIAESL